MKNFIIYISLLFFSVNIYAQKKSLNITQDSTSVIQKNFDANKIEEYKQLDDFRYETVKEEGNIFETFWNWIKRVIKRILSFFFDDIAPAVGFLAFLLRIIPWLIAVVALYFIIKFLLKIDTKNIVKGKTSRATVKLSEDEELLLKQDLKILIKESIKAKNYRLAIRYYYLYSLQKLSDQEFIIWQLEKTNEDYIREIQSKAIKPDFVEATRLYDFVWYGNFNINESEFKQAEVLFNNLTKRIIG
ncbi:MAG: hypothetical protein JXQ93_11750 [Flavobacteriaceae bacterium]